MAEWFENRRSEAEGSGSISVGDCECFLQKPLHINPVKQVLKKAKKERIPPSSMCNKEIMKVSKIGVE